MLAGFISISLIGQNILVYAQEDTELPRVNDTNLQIQEYSSGFKFPTGMEFRSSSLLRGPVPAREARLDTPSGNT